MPALLPELGEHICPYCYETFPQRKIDFRCTGLLGPKGARCAPVRDAAQFERFRRQVSLPPVFSANGRRPKAVHKECETASTQRVCPHCHSDLPVHFGKIDSRLIAMIGAKATGKTVYMTVLLHELLHSVGSRFDASVVGSDDHTRRSFAKEYEDLIYRERKMPAATQTANARLRQPLVFKVTLDRRGLFGTRDRHTITSFFDTAGEDLNTRASTDLNARYLRGATGIILLLDPLQMRGARERAAPGTPLPLLDESTENPLNVLSRVTDLLMETSGKGPGRRISTPIAVAFSKIDALRHTFTADSPLLRDPPSAEPVFDQADSLAVHEHVQALLHEWDGAQIDLLLRRNYDTYRFFGVSALGHKPTADNAVDPTGVRPYRVADPFLWLLSRFNVVPSTKE